MTITAVITIACQALKEYIYKIALALFYKYNLMF